MMTATAAFKTALHYGSHASAPGCDRVSPFGGSGFGYFRPSLRLIIFPFGKSEVGSLRRSSRPPFITGNSPVLLQTGSRMPFGGRKAALHYGNPLALLALTIPFALRRPQGRPSLRGEVRKDGKVGRPDPFGGRKAALHYGFPFGSGPVIPTRFIGGSGLRVASALHSGF